MDDREKMGMPYASGSFISGEFLTREQKEVRSMERRRSQRVPVSGDRFGRVKATVPARIVDISRHGVQLEVPAALRPAVECDLALPVDRRDLRIRAKVQRCRAMGFAGDGHERKLVYRAGLEFISVEQGDQEALFHLVETLSKTPADTRRGRDDGSARINIESGFVQR